MCMIDNCERYEAPFDRWQVAHKVHRCGECHREIASGERYNVSGGKLYGEWDSHKTCVHCAAVREWLEKVCSGWIYEMVGDDLLEHFREGYGIWLGRAYLGIRKKWKRRDGTLMRPMTLPENLPVGAS